jgi:hypothetical protein
MRQGNKVNWLDPAEWDKTPRALPEPKGWPEMRATVGVKSQGRIRCTAVAC